MTYNVIEQGPKPSQLPEMQTEGYPKNKPDRLVKQNKEESNEGVQANKECRTTHREFHTAITKNYKISDR